MVTPKNYIYLFICGMCVCMHKWACVYNGLCVEVREQLVRVDGFCLTGLGIELRLSGSVASPPFYSFCL